LNYRRESRNNISQPIFGMLCVLFNAKSLQRIARFFFSANRNSDFIQIEQIDLPQETFPHKKKKNAYDITQHHTKNFQHVYAEHKSIVTPFMPIVHF
jgi:hypothetical protein